MDPEWLAAWSSFGQAVGTVGAFATGGWLLSREFGRDNRAADDRRKEQASQVHCWTAFHGGAYVPEGLSPHVWTELERQLKDVQPTELGLERPKPVSVYATSVDNRSNAPIYSVKCRIGHEAAIGMMDRRILLPGQSFTIKWVDPSISVQCDASGPTEATFLDSFTRAWHRTKNGALVEPKKPPTWLR